jgi:hypothetical protein
MKLILLLLLVCFASSDSDQTDDPCGEFFISYSKVCTDDAEYFDEIRNAFAVADCRPMSFQR